MPIEIKYIKTIYFPNTMNYLYNEFCLHKNNLNLEYNRSGISHKKLYYLIISNRENRFRGEDPDRRPRGQEEKEERKIDPPLPFSIR